MRKSSKERTKEKRRATNYCHCFIQQIQRMSATIASHPLVENQNPPGSDLFVGFRDEREPALIVPIRYRKYFVIPAESYTLNSHQQLLLTRKESDYTTNIEIGSLVLEIKENG